MTQYRKSVVAPMLALVALSALPLASADEWDKETDVTFSGPVEVPGVVLPAGSYVFKLADSESERNIVQIFRADDDGIIATVVTIPASRPEATDNTVITFEERAADAPEAVHQWFYAGETEGVEFVYPNQPAAGARAAVEDEGSEDVSNAGNVDEKPVQGTQVKPAWQDPFHYVMVIPLPEPETADTADTDVE